MRSTLLAALGLLLSFPLCAQPAPAADAAITLRQIFTEALANGQAYARLEELVHRHPGRLAGSRALEGAVGWSETTLHALGLDRVYRQEVMVPHWERGAPESVRLLPPAGTQGEAVALAALALGGSIATPAAGITAELIEVGSVDELAALGREKIAGKIVFFNGPMDPAEFDPGAAYSRAVRQRSRGPRAAAQLGAVAALVRSMTHALDDVPHTGNTAYVPDAGNIPAAALSTLAANRLSAALAADPSVRIELHIHASWHPEALSHNVIGEIRGSERPEKIIVVGGHLDSWDITPGAHDDGSGVAQSIEVLRIFRALGLQPRHTLRCVLFTNEENGLRGATAYAAAARDSGERHVFAVETDSGGFAPRGFTLGSTQGPVHERAQRWLPLFAPYGITSFTRGTGGADVAPLMVQGTTVGNLEPDAQRYFDYHHTVIDSLDKVNPRELHLGAGALAALIWLVDQEGL
jgi:carboxypeptidase Q